MEIIGDQNLLKAYGRHQISIEKGEGVYLYDTNGKAYLDFYSGIGVNALGYNYPKYNKILHKQLDKVLHISNYFYSPSLLKGSKLLCEHLGLSKAFFTNSGAEAVEGALKLSRKYYYLKHKKADGEIISFHHSFHGRTTGALKLTGNKAYQEAFGPLIDKVYYANLNDKSSVLKLVSEKTSAIIVEPIQGEGGVIPCTKDFLQFLRQLCDEKDICLIFDEVQCGMGRSGKLMAYQYFNVKPDIVCLAKGLGCGVSVGAFVCEEKFDVFTPGDHGSTYGGNPFVLSAVEAVFNIFDEDKIVEHVSELTPYFEEKLYHLKDQCASVEDIRGIGFMQGIVLKNAQSSQYVKKALDEGLIIVSAGKNVIRLLPPLIINKEDIDKAFHILEKILK